MAGEQADAELMQPYDDRVEVPEGFRPEVVAGDHPIVAGIGDPWPILLGYNEVRAKTDPSVEIVMQVPDEAGGHPLLVVGRHGAGRSLAWTSDIAPHWLPDTFARWPGYRRLWEQALAWLTDTGGVSAP